MFKYLLIFMPLLLWGEMISYPAVWNVRNCKVTADTPLGRVYHFPYSEKWTILLPATSVRKSGLHRDNCDCRACSYRKQTVDGGVLEVEIPKKLKADKKRFLSISFKIL